MSNTELFCKKSENLAKRELLVTIMEDMRLIGNTELHLKYLEMYESLKSENKEIEKELAVIMQDIIKLDIKQGKPTIAKKKGK